MQMNVNISKSASERLCSSDIGVAYPVAVYKRSILLLENPMAVHPRFISLLAYPMVVYIHYWHTQLSCIQLGHYCSKLDFTNGCAP